MRLDPGREIPSTGQTVGDFWAWAYSDVDTNVMRAVYAEWLVGTALGCVGGIRPSWPPWDLDYGGSKIEVKSTSYYPNWGQLVDAPSIVAADKLARALGTTLSEMLFELERYNDC